MGTRAIRGRPRIRHSARSQPTRLQVPRSPLAARAGSPPGRSISPIARGPPERLAHLVVDGAGIEADVAERPLVEAGELIARHAAAAPPVQRPDDRAPDQ